MFYCDLVEQCYSPSVETSQFFQARGRFAQIKQQFCLRHHRAPEKGPIPRAFSLKEFKSLTSLLRNLTAQGIISSYISVQLKSKWLQPNKALTQNLLSHIHKNYKASTLFWSFFLESQIDRYWIEGRQLNIKDESWQCSRKIQSTLP